MNIEEARKARGMSRKDVKERLNISEKADSAQNAIKRK